MSVCLSKCVWLTGEPVFFLYNIFSGKVYSYFEGGYHHPHKRNHPLKRKIFKTKIENEGGQLLPIPLIALRGLASNFIIKS